MKVWIVMTDGEIDNVYETKEKAQDRYDDLLEYLGDDDLIEIKEWEVL